MAPVVEAPPKSKFPWPVILWFGALLLIAYYPILRRLLYAWAYNEDMGHGFFVPLIAGFIVWQRKDELMQVKLKPNPWGLVLVGISGALLIVATLGAEVFSSRLAMIFTLIGVIWALGGTLLLKKLAFPLFLLFFMLPIPIVIYNQLTFRLQLVASHLADWALTVLQVPVIREGKLNVVEACSGIRSLLSLTFLTLVYGYFFEKRTWMRVVLFFSTIPIAVIANGSRVTVTALFTQIKAELAEGFFHEAQGWVIFMVALGILILWHQMLSRATGFVNARRAH